MTEKKSFSERFLTVFGDIKFYRFPFFLVYDPGSYQVKGEDVRELLDILQPGDILLRAYTNYLDGKFIPGLFSHAALYYGEMTEALRPKIGERVKNANDRRRAQEELFKPGKQMVVHAMAEGVFVEDILTFSRCDKMAVMRLPEMLSRNQQARPLNMPQGLFTPEEKRLQEQLSSGKSVSKKEAVALALAEAVRNVGRPYDFNFDFANFGRLCCSELVYLCYKAIDQYIDVLPVEKRMLFIRKQVIAPDAFLDARLACIWASRSVRKELAGRRVALPAGYSGPAPGMAV